MIGAKGVLFNVTGGANIGIHEIDEAAKIINNASDDDAFIIWGHVFDPEMDDAVKITVIATGFDEAIAAQQKPDLHAVTGTKPLTRSETIVVSVPAQQPASPVSGSQPMPQKVRQEMGETEVRLAGAEGEDLFRSSGAPADQLDVPAYLRKKKS